MEQDEYPEPSPTAVQWIRDNPDRLSDFNAKYGAGAGERLLPVVEQPATAVEAEPEVEEEQSWGDIAADVGEGIVEGALSIGTETAAFFGDIASSQGAHEYMSAEQMAELGLGTAEQLQGVQTEQAAAEVEVQQNNQIMQDKLDKVTIFGKQRDSTAGALTQGTVQFLGAMFGVGKIAKVKAFTTWKGATGAGFAADAVAFDPEMANIVKILEEEFGADSELVTKALADGDGGPWDTKLKNKLIRLGSAIGDNETVVGIFSNDELTNMENRVKNGILGTALATPFDVGILIYRGLRIKGKAAREVAETGNVSDETAAQAAEIEDAVTTWKELVEREAVNPIQGSTYNPELKQITTKDGMVFSMETGARVLDADVPTTAPKGPDAAETGAAPKVVDEVAQPPKIDTEAPAAPAANSLQAPQQGPILPASAADNAAVPTAAPAGSKAPEVGTAPKVGDSAAPPSVQTTAPVAPVAPAAPKPLKVFKPKAIANTIKELKTDPAKLQTLAEDLNDRFVLNPKYFEGPRDSDAILLATSKELEKAGLFKEMGTATTESLDTVADESIDILARELNVSPKSFRRKLATVADNASEQYRWGVAGKIEMVRLERAIVDIADQIDAKVAKGENVDDLRRTFLETIDAHGDVQNSILAIKTGSGRGLNANKIKIDSGVTDQAIDRLELMGGSIQGGKKVDAMIRQMRMAKTPAAKNAIFRQQSSFWSKVWGVMGELFINGILAGPHTHALNIGASSINIVARPTLRTVGAVLKGDVKTARKGLRQQYFMISTLAENLNLIHFNGGLLPRLNTQNSALASSISSIAKDKTLLDTTSKIGAEGDSVRQISSRNFGINKYVGAPIDLAGTLINSTSRVLGAEDQFFKHMIYRSTVKAAAATDAAEMTLKDLEDLGFIEGTLRRRRLDYMKDAVASSLNTKEVLDSQWAQLVREGRVLDEPSAKADFMGKNLDSYNASSKYAQEALEEARHGTFTTPLPKDSMMYGAKMWVIQVPALRQVIPFIQTPTNVLRENFQRVPVLNKIATGLRKELESPNPEIAAMAKGKVVYGVAMTTYALYLASQGRLTGSGPSYVTDPKLAEMWNKSPNWQANSVVSWDDNDNPVFTDMSKMLPHFGAFTMVGQAQEYYDRYEGEGQDGTFIFAALANMFANQVTMQSSLSSVGDFMQVASGDSKPYEFNRFLKSRVAAMIPLSSLSYTLNKEQDGVMRDLNGFFETLKSRMYDPVLEAAGGERNAPAKHFWLTGEAQDIPEYAWGFLKSKTFDNMDGDTGYVFEELRKLPKGLSGPRRKIGTAELSPAAFQELNRLYGTVKIDGMTLVQRLAETIDSYGYDRNAERQPYGISDFRRDLLQADVAEYREEALSAMADEFPELEDLIERQLEVEDELNAGGMPANPELLNEQFDIKF